MSNFERIAKILFRGHSLQGAIALTDHPLGDLTRLIEILLELHIGWYSVQGIVRPQLE